MTDIHVRLNVTCSFSVTLGITPDFQAKHSPLENDALKRVAAVHIRELIANGALPDCIDRIEIAEVATDSDETIVRGTNG